MIGGFRPGSNSVDALLVGYYDDPGLRFSGKVRAGFVPHLPREVFIRWGGGVTADEMREMQG